MRTSTRTRGTTGSTRRAPVFSTVAAVCMALPLSGLLGGTALAASGDGSAALKAASDKGNSAAAQAAAQTKKDDKAAASSAAAPGDAGFIGPVAKKNDKKDDAAPAGGTTPANTAGGAKDVSPKAAPQPTPFSNEGGLTTGANKNKYETVNDGKGISNPGMTPQPYSNADKNNKGANDTSASNPYTSTRDGSPSLNGNGGGKQVGQPCAGCVGKADNKNPKGQAPGGSDHNAGYECDRNHGIGRSNPAHTACTTPSTPPTTPPTCTPKPGQDKDCNPLPTCTPKPGQNSDCTPKLCPGTNVPAPNGDVTACVKDENDHQKVTLCHATGSRNNPYVVITVGVNSVVKGKGHDAHAGDVIPVFTYTDKSGATHTYPGKNGGDITRCGATPPPPPVCVPSSTTSCTPPPVCVPSSTTSCTPPPVCVPSSTTSCTPPPCVAPNTMVNGVCTPPPGCVETPSHPCTPPIGCPAGSTMNQGVCEFPVTTVCPKGTKQLPNGTCVIKGGTPDQPVEGNSNTPVTVIHGDTTPPAAVERALPFTGTDALLLVELAGLLLVVGGGLLVIGRSKKAVRTL